VLFFFLPPPSGKETTFRAGVAVTDSLALRQTFLPREYQEANLAAGAGRSDRFRFGASLGNYTRKMTIGPLKQQGAEPRPAPSLLSLIDFKFVAGFEQPGVHLAISAFSTSAASACGVRSAGFRKSRYRGRAAACARSRRRALFGRPPHSSFSITGRPACPSGQRSRFQGLGHWGIPARPASAVVGNVGQGTDCAPWVREPP